MSLRDPYIFAWTFLPGQAAGPLALEVKTPPIYKQGSTECDILQIIGAPNILRVRSSPEVQDMKYTASQDCGTGRDNAGQQVPANPALIKDGPASMSG